MKKYLALLLIFAFVFSALADADVLNYDFETSTTSLTTTGPVSESLRKQLSEFRAFDNLIHSDETGSSLKTTLKDYANEIRNLADAIQLENEDNEAKYVKAELYLLSSHYDNMADHASEEFLKSALFGQDDAEVGGVETLFLKKIVKGVKKVVKKVKKVVKKVKNSKLFKAVTKIAPKLLMGSGFLTGVAAPFLAKINLGGLAKVATSIGGKISKVATKVASLEQKAKTFIQGTKIYQTIQKGKDIYDQAKQAVDLLKTARDVWRTEQAGQYEHLEEPQVLPAEPIKQEVEPAQEVPTHLSDRATAAPRNVKTAKVLSSETEEYVIEQEEEDGVETLSEQGDPALIMEDGPVYGPEAGVEAKPLFLKKLGRKIGKIVDKVTRGVEKFNEIKDRVTNVVEQVRPVIGTIKNVVRRRRIRI